MKRTQKTLASVSSNRYPSVFFFLNSSSSVFFYYSVSKNATGQSYQNFFFISKFGFSNKEGGETKKKYINKKKRQKRRKTPEKSRFL